MMMRNKNRKAFTLLEILAASVIGAFLAMVAVSTLRTVTAGRVRVDDNITAAEELRFAAYMIRTDLANLYRDQSNDNMKLIGMLSESETSPSSDLTVRVVSQTKARSAFVEAHTYDVQYSLANKDGKSLLLRRKCPVVGPEEPEQVLGGMLTTIAENILVFNVRYFDTTQWLEVWPEDAGEMPALMEISLATVIGDADVDEPKVMTKSFLVSFPRLIQSDGDAASQITDIDDIDSAGAVDSLETMGGGN